MYNIFGLAEDSLSSDPNVDMAVYAKFGITQGCFGKALMTPDDYNYIRFIHNATYQYDKAAGASWRLIIIYRQTQS